MSEGVPDLPRFARDVRVTGSDSGPTATVGPWAGVGRPFGGLLDPALGRGDWPPAALSHLALGSLLGDALRPRASPGPSDESSRGRPDEDADATAEPTVREVIRDAGEARASTAGDVSEPDATTSSVPAEPTTFEGESTGSVEVTGPSGPPTGSGDDVLVSIPELETTAAPRTVLRQGGGGPTRVTTREIARVLEEADGVHDSDESGPADRAGVSPQSGAGRPAESTDRSEASSGRPVWPATGSSEGWAPPLDLTMPTVPPELGASVSDDGAGGASGGPPTPAAAATDAPGPGDDPGGTDQQPRTGAAGAADVASRMASARGDAAPPMTVRQESAAPDETGASQQASREGAVAGDVAAEQAVAEPAVAEPEAAARGDRASPQARAAGVTDASDAGMASLLDGLEPGEPEVVHRTIADAVSQPRVIDRLYHELERRRRIERERGGRR